ncbi:MAG: DUF86 domain-containing protein, partial [Dehalococcoidia bacterium]
MKYNGVIQRKFALLDDHVQELTRYLSTMNYREFESSRVARLATERALQVCAEIMIDVAERIIAIEHAGPTSSAADALAKLQTLGVIQEAQRYIGIVRFRNLIVHEYEEIHPRLLFDLATTRLTDLMAFRDEIDR